MPGAGPAPPQLAGHLEGDQRAHAVPEEQKRHVELRHEIVGQHPDDLIDFGQRRLPELTAMAGYSTGTTFTNGGNQRDHWPYTDAAPTANGKQNIRQDGVAQTLTVAIPNASVLTLSSVGYQLLPAPGAGNMYIVDRIVVEQVAKTGAFAGSPGNMTAAYGTQSSQVAATGTIAGTILTGGSGTTNQIGMAIGIAPANGNSSVLLNSAIGLYDCEAGISRMQHKLKPLYGRNLRAALAERFGWRPSQLRFLKDATAYLMGKLAAGSAQGAARAVGLTLGTGSAALSPWTAAA